MTISEPEKTHKRIQDYFDKVEFIKWDDVVPPKVFFSNDATMAYAVIEKQVILSIPNQAIPDTTDFAWVAIYRKIKK